MDFASGSRPVVHLPSSTLVLAGYFAHTFRSFASQQRLRDRERSLIPQQIEYLVVSFDDDNRQVKLSLRQADILVALANDEKLLKQGGGVPDIRRGEGK